jgi:hypothetical protein
MKLVTLHGVNLLGQDLDEEDLLEAAHQAEADWIESLTEPTPMDVREGHIVWHEHVTDIIWELNDEL